MTRKELDSIGERLGLNCGGKGGKPGPCSSKNPSRGFQGENGGEETEEGNTKFTAAVKQIMKKHKVTAAVARNYLDSTAGRHVGGYVARDGKDVHSAMEQYHGGQKGVSKALEEIKKQTKQGYFR